MGSQNWVYPEGGWLGKLRFHLLPSRPAGTGAPGQPDRSAHSGGNGRERRARHQRHWQAGHTAG